MSFRMLAVSAFLVLHFLAGFASPIVTGAQDELVKVPGGYLLKSNVHAVPEGGRIVHSSDSVQLIDAGGRVLHYASLSRSKPAFTRLNRPSSEVRRNLESAIVAAIWDAPSIFTFTSDWIVPPAPQKYSNQLLYYFSALLPPSGDAFIQPVLQYGPSVAGGGAYWSVGSWFIAGDTGYYTNLTQVLSGEQNVYPFILDEDEFLGTPTTHAWYCGFEFHQQESSLNIQTSETFNVAYVALEAYNAISLLNLPGQTTNIVNIAIANDDNEFSSPIPWTLFNDTADGITMKVVSASNGDGAALQIQYVGNSSSKQGLEGERVEEQLTMKTSRRH
ncbi:hypothetical protein CPB84DRAFT_1847156 [Gymnopilus junonius]|uniref:Uncharacterized protein n=1 Tax=Gymnopilus junonius TaxID=109634 RepID=A0A9P5NKR6_GYMJU|nr:hypothetical protein CPB84DRAFT_1847156 [Gymnopilus junonius]